MNHLKRAAEQALQHARGGGKGRWPRPTAQEIRDVRVSLGMTQRQFASRFGFELDSIKSWEAERRYPEQANCLLLAMVQSDPALVEMLIARIEDQRGLSGTFVTPPWTKDEDKAETHSVLVPG